MLSVCSGCRFVLFAGLFSPSGSWEGRLEGAPEGGRVVYVLVARVTCLRVWVLGFRAFVVGCCGRVVSGGV